MAEYKLGFQQFYELGKLYKAFCGLHEIGVSAIMLDMLDERAFYCAQP
jgi:hypothetical protein